MYEYRLTYQAPNGFIITEIVIADNFAEATKGRDETFKLLNFTRKPRHD